MNKIRNLTICPSINRPLQITKMLESFYKTQICSDIIILTKIGSITEEINNVNYKEYSHITVTNDDFIFETYAWDSILIQSMTGLPKFSYGYDGINKDIPSTCMIDTRIVDALGWIQLPTLQHLCGDLVWSYIGQKINIIKFVSNVRITHNHFLYKKSEKDSVYDKTNSPEMYKKDNQEFRRWVREEAQEDIERVRLVL